MSDLSEWLGIDINLKREAQKALDRHKPAILKMIDDTLAAAKEKTATEASLRWSLIEAVFALRLPPYAESIALHVVKTLDLDRYQGATAREAIDREGARLKEKVKGARL